MQFGRRFQIGFGLFPAGIGLGYRLQFFLFFQKSGGQLRVGIDRTVLQLLLQLQIVGFHLSQLVEHGHPSEQ